MSNSSSTADMASFNQKWLAPISTVSWIIATAAACLQFGFVILILFYARDDKPVRRAGLGFLLYLLTGGLCGQGLLIAHSAQLYRIGANDWPTDADGSLLTTWTQCHAQPTLLFLHLGLHAAPLSAILWRVWFKIRTAETRRLNLWDRIAQRICLLQLILLIALVIAHYVVAASDYDDEPRVDCVSDTNPVQERAEPRHSLSSSSCSSSSRVPSAQALSPPAPLASRLLPRA